MPRTKKKIENKPLFKLNLTLAGNTYLSEGETLRDAIVKLQYPRVSKMGVLSVNYGDKNAMVKLTAPRLRFVKINKFHQAVVEKQVGVRLK